MQHLVGGRVVHDYRDGFGRIESRRHGDKLIWSQSDVICVAARHGERGHQLARIYDEGLAQLIESGRLRTIFDRYELPYPF